MNKNYDEFILWLVEQIHVISKPVLNGYTILA